MPLDQKTHQQLWAKYAEARDPKTRETLIEENAYLIKLVAGRMSIYYHACLEYEDLISFGVFGLIDAVDKFDPKKGVKFETYASLRIRGAILDNIRSLDWAPRSLRDKGKELERALTALEGELGRPPTDEEAAQGMGLSLKEFRKLVDDASIATLVSLEETVETAPDGGEFDSPWLEDRTDGPERQAEFTELKEILAREIETLSEKERTVISLYYFEELTLKEISKIMQVTESRISQLHTKAIAKLRGKLGNLLSANAE